MAVHIHAHQSHLAWDNSLSPIATIESGEIITVSCLDASNGQITAKSTLKDLEAMDFARLDQVNGPVYVKGASVGDVLEVEFLEIKHSEWGWTAIIDNFGLLQNEYPQTLKIWKVEADHAMFNDHIRIPIDPFCGEVGVARGEKGAFSTIPPYRTGGNIDTKHVTVGTKLYLPIECEGALFSIGDGHGSQGDGEVCGTAIEMPMDVKVRLSVIKNKPYVKTPHLLAEKVSGAVASGRDQKGFYATTGVGPDLMTATKEAIRSMIDWLETEHKLSRPEAYMLCSVIVDLKITEIVDAPNFIIGAFCPLSIFV